MPKKPINSRQKGKRGEREACQLLRKLGFSDARRTQQYNGEGLSDVVAPDSLPGLHIEVKYGYSYSDLSANGKIIREAIEQCERDCPPNESWIILSRSTGARYWQATFLTHDGYYVTINQNQIRKALEHLLP